MQSCACTPSRAPIASSWLGETMLRPCRLQRDEYALRGSGWVRTISGIQSLLSVYLLAMWALTQFGRLFEG